MIDTAIHNEIDDDVPVANDASVLDLLRAALEATRAVIDAQRPEGVESSLDRVGTIFSLTTFERDIILLCAAAELVAGFGDLCGAIQSDERLAYPTFQMALQLLPEAHWSATLPQGALRRLQLIELGVSEILLTSRISLDETVLHFLMGSSSLDARLDGLLIAVTPPRVLPAVYRSCAEQLASLLKTGESLEIAQLIGSASQSRFSIAAAACAALGQQAYLLRAGQWLSLHSNNSGLQRVLERDAMLCGFTVVLDTTDTSPVERDAALRLADSFAGRLILCGEGITGLRQRRVRRLVVDRPVAADQAALWKFALGDQAACFNGQISRVASQFSLDCETILQTGFSLRARLQDNEEDRAIAGELLAESCRIEARPGLDALAQRIPPRARWNDIVLPEMSLDMLRAIAAQVRQQGKVLDSWGFARQTARGLGISALFHGHSGTGKTLAAEVLANELKLDLFRIDLSQMVSKYIGETEKNLRAIFDAAESTGSVLLFDEADALFGKRSEVRDSHDRYANIEVSYLLQRIESFRGLAILTTNLRAALDTAFLRRISFFVSFPFPDQLLRRNIWERMFPTEMPSEKIDFDKLARLNLPGGNIRNIALHAAYIAADREEPVRMQHLLTAAKRECMKMERPLTAAETGGWL